MNITIKTKIIATLGPASSTETELRKMFKAGLDVVRLNFSHGTQTEHGDRIDLVRSLNRKMRRAIKIMADLEGYRIRIGKLGDSILLRKGANYFFIREGVAEEEHDIPFDYSGPLDRIEVGTRIFIDDGRIAVDVVEIEPKRLNVKCLVGGELKSHKGVNIPSAEFDFIGITEKDEEDIAFAVEQGVDYIAQSFVRNAQDLRTIRNKVAHRLPGCRIVAKVENRQALTNIDEIISEADCIMVARGDLGISVPIHQVPMIQKDIIRQCRLKGKPVIVATQMLESMVEEILPTRAEVSDVANAILDGATHLMLSAETAVGKHPHRVIDMMNHIIEYTEQNRRK